MMKKKLAWLCIGCMAVSVLAGCGGNADAGNDTPAQQEASEEAGEEAVEGEADSPAEGSGEAAGNGETISMMCWYDEDDMEGVVNAVNEQLNGEYVLEYTYVALSDYNNVLSTQLAAGEGPDIVADETDFLARIKAGNLMDISDMDIISEFSEDGFALCSEGGKYYGIPSYGWFAGIWYNQDILDECNVTLPKTLEEFIEACRTIQAAGYEPVGFGLADGDTAHANLFGYLENVFYHNNDKNADGIGFDEKFARGEVSFEGNINEHVEKWYRLIEEGFITSEMLGISNEEALNNFIAGRTAFFNGGPWQYTSFADAGIHFGMMPQLSDTGENVYVIGGAAASYGINANTKNEAGAKAVLSALGSVEAQQAMLESNPGGMSYRNGVIANMPEEYESVRDAIDNGNISYAANRWSVDMPAASLVDESISQIQGLISGDLTVDEYIAALDAKADSIRYE